MKRQMKILVAALIGVAILGYFGRGAIRDAWDEARAPKLPPAAAYKPSANGADTLGAQDVTTPFETGYSTSENYILETAPPAKPPPRDPLAFTGELPSELNLDVPFTTQAPYANWGAPYQEGCEEASAIMVDAFYRGRTGRIPQAEADAAILKMVAYEESIDYAEDITAEQLAALMKTYYGYGQAIAKPLTSPDDIKRMLALGYPVMVPMAGKLLGNPNFKNGGPPYHMLVMRGYTPTMFITNDPGTRKGEEYVYTYDTIMKSAHDWTGDKTTIATGKPMMIVVIPNTP